MYGRLTVLDPVIDVAVLAGIGSVDELFVYSLKKVGGRFIHFGFESDNICHRVDAGNWFLKICMFSLVLGTCDRWYSFTVLDEVYVSLAHIPRMRNTYVHLLPYVVRVCFGKIGLESEDVFVHALFGQKDDIGSVSDNVSILLLKVLNGFKQSVVICFVVPPKIRKFAYPWTRNLTESRPECLFQTEDYYGENAKGEENQRQHFGDNEIGARGRREIRTQRRRNGERREITYVCLYEETPIRFSSKPDAEQNSEARYSQCSENC